MKIINRAHACVWPVQCDSLIVAETFRSAAADDGSLVASLTPLLKIEDSIDVQLQVLRALGNLCHEEGKSDLAASHTSSCQFHFLLDRCREQLWKAGGCPLLAGVLERCTSLPVSVEYYRYKTVTSGCILNACHDNGEQMIDCAIVHAVISIALQIVWLRPWQWINR